MKTTIKKLLATAMLFASITIAAPAAYSEELKVIIPSDPSGSYTVRFRIIEESLKETWGDDIEYVWTGNCANGLSTINNIRGPWISMLDVASNLNESCTNWPAKEEVLAVESSPVRLCVRADSELTLDDFTKPNDNKILLGHSTPANVFQSWAENFNLAAGSNIQNVPYNSSGGARRGLLAGDVDAVFISTGNSNKLMNSGDGKCLATTNPNGEDRYGLPALKDSIDFPYSTMSLVNYYFGGNMTDSKYNSLRDFFSTLADGTNPEVVKYQNALDLTLVSEGQAGIDGMYDILGQSLNTWKPLSE